MKNIFSKKYKILLFLLTMVLVITGCYNCITAFAIIAPEDSIPYYQIQTFLVASKNTTTGEVTTKEYDTSVTTAALNKGETALSTPAFVGTEALREESNILGNICLIT